MKGIARFFTLYIIIYFPTCIAFNELPGFSSIDEAMTGVLILYTFFIYISKRKKAIYLNRRPMKEYLIFLGILVFYTIYSLRYGANVSGGVWLDFIQELRPYSIIFCTWILNPQLTKFQKKAILTVVVLTLLVLIVVNPESYLGEDGSKHEFYVLGQVSINAGMLYYIFSDKTKRNTYIAVALSLACIAHPKAKYLGEVVCFVIFLIYIKNKFNFKSPKTIIGLFFLIALLITVTWTKFDKYYVTGMSNEYIARPMTYKTAFGKILWDYFPLGSGMGSFACNGAWKYYSPLYPKYDLDTIWGLDKGGGFICDAYYPSLCQYGIVGIFLFCWFWKRRLTEMNKIKDMRYYKVAFLCFLCLAIEQVADSTFVSGKGMGFCMLIGLCMNANRNADIVNLVKQRKKKLAEQSDMATEISTESNEEANEATV